MFSRNRDEHHESGARGGIVPSHTASSLSFFKGTSPQQKAGDGVSTYLALTFGTLLSSQGTDASFVLTLSGFPPGASLRCFRLYQIFPIRFPRCFPGARAFAFPFPAGPTLSEVSGRTDRPSFSDISGGASAKSSSRREAARRSLSPSG